MAVPQEHCFCTPSMTKGHCLKWTYQFSMGLCHPHETAGDMQELWCQMLIVINMFYFSKKKLFTRFLSKFRKFALQETLWVAFVLSSHLPKLKQFLYHPSSIRVNLARPKPAPPSPIVIVHHSMHALRGSLKCNDIY